MAKSEYGKLYKRTKDGVISNMYGHQRGSSKRRGHAMPTYSKEELKEWLYSQTTFHIMYDNWKRLDYQSMYKPSVDRIDSIFGYTIANIQLMTWKENNLKGITERLGSKHYRAKPKEYYVTKTTTRADFKKACVSKGWDIKDFKEVCSTEKSSMNKRYYYKEIIVLGR